MDEKVVKDSQGLVKDLVNDCISRKATLDALEKSKEIYFDRQVIIGAMKDIVRNLPSGQPEIIRCRDCVWHDVNVCRNKNSIPWNDDDFCSYAERREVSE